MSLLGLGLLGLGLFACVAHVSEFNLPGFVTEVEGGRLWVLALGDDA
ncbi:hypothetical protein [Shewanella sp.]